MFKKKLRNRIKMIKKLLCFTSLLIMFLSCGKDETDQELLQKDKENLEESLKSDMVAKYKFLKIAIRSSVPMENYPKEFLPFKEKFNDLSQTLNEVDKQDISIIEMASVYKDYLDLKKVIDKTDEDVFPTLTESFTYSSNTKIASQTLMTGDEKKETESYEHAIMGVFMVLSKDVGQELVLYELSEIQPDKIQDKQLKAIMQLNRGLLFLSKGLYYLSENEMTNNINWLNENKMLDLKIIQLLLGWQNFSQEQNYLAFHSINHLFRGLDRLSMDREIDEKRALEDLEVFLEDCNKLGLNNELVYCTDAYVNIKKENPEKAIIALTKLKSSPIISASDKKDIEKTISYLKNRESDKVMNGVYDKAFVSKIALSFVYDKLTKIDWEKVFKENNIEHGDAILLAIKNFKKINQNLQDIKDLKYLKENTNKIKGEGIKIWDKAKELIE